MKRKKVVAAQFKLRVPSRLRKQLQAVADESGFSLNREMISRLERSLESGEQTKAIDALDRNVLITADICAAFERNVMVLADLCVRLDSLIDESHKRGVSNELGEIDDRTAL